MAVTKPSGTLKAYLDTKKTESRLIGPIERHMLVRELDTSRRQDVIHPSDLIKSDFCMRAQYFKMLNPVEPDRPTLRLQSIFDTGHGAHAKWQGYIHDMGHLYGLWVCMACGHDFWATSPKECRQCLSEKFLKYREVPLIDASLSIAGHSDGWVVELGDPFLIEIKTIGTGTIRMEAPSILAANDGDLSKSWRDIRRPFPTHLRQGQLYLELVRRMKETGYFDGLEIPREIVYLYELKADQGYKEFVVKADPEVISDCLDMAFDITRALDTNTPPSCNVSESGSCKYCSAYAEEE